MPVPKRQELFFLQKSHPTTGSFKPKKSDAHPGLEPRFNQNEPGASQFFSLFSVSDSDAEFSVIILEAVKRTFHSTYPSFSRDEQWFNYFDDTSLIKLYILTLLDPLLIRTGSD